MSTRLRHFVAIIAAAAILATAAVVGSAAISRAEVERAAFASAQAALDRAEQAYTEWIGDLQHLRISQKAVIDAAERKVNESEGQVGDESSRTALQRYVAYAKLHLDAADRANLDAMSVYAVAAGFEDGTVRGADLAAESYGTRPDYGSMFDTDAKVLDKLGADVDSAMSEWAIELERRAAEEAAAAGGSSGAELSDGSYSIYVRTWGVGVAQAEVDAGGQVAIDYGFAVGFAAHNYNDATALYLQPGDIVYVSGVVNGVF